MIFHFLKPDLQKFSLFGERQFAYAEGRGVQDALAFSVLSWLTLLEKGRLVGLYCSDVSGAFDRVSEACLGKKLDALGLHPQILVFLKAWLAPRELSVVLDSFASKRCPLTNSVYQGTVLGPPLWNLHYADSAFAIQEANFQEIIFADDLNAFQGFPSEFSQEKIISELSFCQSRLHAWGLANQVKFDLGKQHFHILHRTRAFEDDFEILGVRFDNGLIMSSACDRISKDAGWRLAALLRCQRFFSVANLVQLYKAQTLSFIESRTPAIYHASNSVLASIDRIQSRFLSKISVSPAIALKKYRLAPLRSRRDIAMLILLFRIAHGTAPRCLCSLFSRKYIRSGFSTRAELLRHPLQFYEFSEVGGHTETYRRSAFGLVTIWNMLPFFVVEAANTGILRNYLMKALMKYSDSGISEWENFFWSARQMTVPDFQRWFL